MKRKTCVNTARYPKICYTPEGQEAREKLWDETMEELKFAGASEVVKSLEGASQ
jgi:hypothetical protein